MRIYCDDLSVFNESEHRGLQRLLMCVRRGQHTLILDDTEAFFQTRFFTMAVALGDRQEVRELLEKQLPALSDRSLDPAMRARGVRAELIPIALTTHLCRRDGEDTVWCIDPSTAGDWSEAPLRVLLENDADWILVETAARIYARPHVRRALAQGFVQKDQRGGKGEVKKSVERSAQHERIFVLMDSDRTSNCSLEGADQQKVRQLAETMPHIKVFILRKREVENYVPETVWNAATGQPWPGSESKKQKIVERRQAVANWTRLSDEEKDFIDLETYFSDAKMHVERLNDATLVPDATTLESRDTKRELLSLLNELEAWL